MKELFSLSCTWGILRLSSMEILQLIQMEYLKIILKIIPEDIEA